MSATRRLLSVIPPLVSLSIGSNSMTYEDSGGVPASSLVSNSITINSGSIVFAMPGMGAIANLVAPTDNSGNTYSPLLPAHNYINWSGAGHRMYASSGVTGGSGRIISEAMSDVNDEVTLSVIEVRGGSTISNVAATETASPGPVTSASAVVSGQAMLLSWWWGDGVLVQASASPSVGWTKVHELNNTMMVSGVLQVALAVRLVTAGTYSCTWTADDGFGGAGTQGAVCYIAAVE